MEPDSYSVGLRAQSLATGLKEIVGGVQLPPPFLLFDASHPFKSLSIPECPHGQSWHSQGLAFLEDPNTAPRFPIGREAVEVLHVSLAFR